MDVTLVAGDSAVAFLSSCRGGEVVLRGMLLHVVLRGQSFFEAHCFMLALTSLLPDSRGSTW
jgi:hypothetical protein